MLVNAHAVVEGDLDPSGVKGEAVSPHIQALRMQLTLTGPTLEQGNIMIEAIESRCPVYTTLKRAAPIELTLNLQSE